MPWLDGPAAVNRDSPQATKQVSKKKPQSVVVKKHNKQLPQTALGCLGVQNPVRRLAINVVFHPGA